MAAVNSQQVSCQATELRQTYYYDFFERIKKNNEEVNFKNSLNNSLMESKKIKRMSRKSLNASKSMETKATINSIQKPTKRIDVSTYNVSRTPSKNKRPLIKNTSLNSSKGPQTPPKKRPESRTKSSIANKSVRARKVGDPHCHSKSKSKEKKRYRKMKQHTTVVHIAIITHC